MDVAGLKAAHSQKIHRFKELGTGLRVKKVAKDKVLVKLIEDMTMMDEAEKLGIVITDTQKKEHRPIPSKGVVVEIGYLVTEWAVGDMVLFGKFSGIDFRCSEQDLRVVHEDDVICSFEDTDGSVVQVETENPL